MKMFDAAGLFWLVCILLSYSALAQHVYENMDDYRHYEPCGLGCCEPGSL